MKGRPIILSLFWWKIDGLLILTHDIVSEVSDNAVRMKWLKERCQPRWDNGHRLAYTDVMNFHDVIHRISEQPAELSRNESASGQS